MRRPYALFTGLSPVAFAGVARQGIFGENAGMNGITRWLLCAAIAAGISYFFVRHNVPVPWTTVWKGAGVGLLALWCATQARSVDGWLVTAVMAFGALGDVLLETAGMTIGAVAFVVGHVLAMLLYFRNWRPRLTLSQRLLAALVVPLSVFIAATLVPAKDAVSIAIYTVFVAGMAATGWTSRFPRYRVGIGAMMFLISDLLIFAKMGPLAASPLPSLLIWPLYFAGQVLIASGVVRTLRTADSGSGA
ncbi:MAG: lysoplasmalogenase [Pseudomonadota bacterium]